MAKGTTSPRRLSRVSRQPPPPSHSNSVSSNTSNRAERNTRSHNKASSPQKSSTPQSLSSEELADGAHAATTDPPQLRRSRRTHDNDEDGDLKLEDPAEDEIIEEEETTRCLCGHQEYPGLPASLAAAFGGKTAPGSNQDDQADERGGLFISCDVCQVWQHGGCVSIMEESAVPDNYYCEECKPELHELHKTHNGQKFSHYLPVWWKTHPKVTRKGSVEKDDKSKTLKEKEKLAKALPEAKRRSTMNSRAAYDEDEVLRKVLEESKTEGQGSTDNGSRKGKRTRDDSADARYDIKRQRTGSSVLSSHSGDESAEESDSAHNSKKARPVQAPKSLREKELRDKERAVATATTMAAGNQRKGRTRRNGESVVVEPEPASAVEDAQQSSSADISAKQSPVNPKADSPDAPGVNNTSISTAANANKRGGKRPGAGRGRSNPALAPSDREGNEKDSSNGDGRDTPLQQALPASSSGKRGKRGQNASKDESGESDKDTSAHNANGTNGQTGSDAEKADSSGTPSAATPAANGSSSITGAKKREPSMNELKRRAAAMSDWVEKAKDDLSRSSMVTASLLGTGGHMSPFKKDVMLGAGGVELSSVAEMLHSRLLGWQAEYGAG